jgi:hypothetical protein
VTRETIGVVYYMMNDRTALSDYAGVETGSIGQWRRLAGDVAREARPRIARTLSEVRSGGVRLNREGDADFFDRQASMATYVLTNNPLVRLFTLPDDQEPQP